MALASDAVHTHSPALTEDLSDLAITPTTTITDVSEDTASSSGTATGGSDGGITFDDLITLVKNQGEQLAEYGEAVKELRAENPVLRRELHGNFDGDKIVHNAQHGHVPNLEKLVEAKFDALDGKIAAINDIFHAYNEAAAKEGGTATARLCGTAEEVCRSCSDRFSEVHKRLEGHDDRLNLTSSCLRRLVEALRNEIRSNKKGLQDQVDAVKAKLLSPITTKELLEGQARTEASMVSGLARLSAADATLRREQRTATDDISTLEASMKDLSVELRMKDAKIERRLENMGRVREYGSDSFDLREPWKEPQTRNPLEERKFSEDDHPESAIFHEFKKLRTRIKFLEDDSFAAMDMVNPASKKDINRLWKKVNAVSSKTENAVGEIESLKLQSGGANDTETVSELEERVDSLTEEVSSLRTSQQDHRRALYDWSSNVDKNKRKLEEKVTDVVSRMESLEKKTAPERSSREANMRSSSTRLGIPPNTETVGARNRCASFVGGVPRLGAVYGQPPQPCEEQFRRSQERLVER